MKTVLSLFRFLSEICPEVAYFTEIVEMEEEAEGFVVMVMVSSILIKPINLIWASIYEVQFPK